MILEEKFQGNLTSCIKLGDGDSSCPRKCCKLKQYTRNPTHQFPVTI